MKHDVYRLMSGWIYLATKGADRKIQARARRAILAMFLSPGTYYASREMYDDWYGVEGAR